MCTLDVSYGITVVPCQKGVSVWRVRGYVDFFFFFLMACYGMLFALFYYHIGEWNMETNSARLLREAARRVRLARLSFRGSWDREQTARTLRIAQAEFRAVLESARR